MALLPFGIFIFSCSSISCCTQHAWVWGEELLRYTQSWYKVRTYDCPKTCLVYHRLQNTFCFDRLFMWPRLVPHFNNRPRGNTGSCVVDTGVSLSTRASPIYSTPSAQLISCRGRKWQGGQGSERAGVMMMSQQEKKDRTVAGGST